MHFLSGIFAFGAFAPEGTPVALYSLGYQAAYVFPDIVIAIAAGVLVFSSKSFVKAVKKFNASKDSAQAVTQTAAQTSGENVRSTFSYPFSVSENSPCGDGIPARGIFDAERLCSRLLFSAKHTRGRTFPKGHSVLTAGAVLPALVSAAGVRRAFAARAAAKIRALLIYRPF